jgi:hypothetical protein
MMRTMILFLAAALTLQAQAATKTDLLKLNDELEASIQAGDWAKAAKLSQSLRGAVQDARNESMAAGGSKLVDSILAWLPADTVTLVVGQEPFTISERDRTKTPNALEGAQSYVLGLLAAAEKENLMKELSGRTVRLAALGARGFGEEHAGDQGTGLGMIRYQGCAVYAFTESVAESILGRTPEESIMGHRVWISKGSQNDSRNTETYLVALLKPDLMMACNDREFFREMVSRMDMPSQRRGLPPGLPEWKQLDRTVPLWAISHYDGNGLLQAVLARAGNDFEATGVTIEFGLAAGAVRARMLAKSDPWKDVVEQPEFNGAAKSREAAKGVWELSVDGTPDAALLSVLVLMSAVGFVVFI